MGIADDKSYVVAYMERDDQQFPDDSDDKIQTRRFTAAGDVKEDCGNFCRPNDLDFISGIQATNNSNGFIVAYVNGESSSRVMLRRYADPVDLAGQAFDAARSATDSREQLKAGESTQRLDGGEEMMTNMNWGAPTRSA